MNDTFSAFKNATILRKGVLSVLELLIDYLLLFSENFMYIYASFNNLATVCTSLSPRPEQLITIRGLSVSWGHRVSR